MAVDAELAAAGAALEAWKADWASGNASAYIAGYSSSFGGELFSRAAWEKQRRQRLAYRGIRVQFNDVKSSARNGTVVTEFSQRYSSAGHEDVGVKTMQWQKLDDQWRIVGEQWKKS